VDERIEFESGELERDDISIYPVPLTKIVDEIKGRPVIKNTVALGAALAHENLFYPPSSTIHRCTSIV
jgi:Pyruvate/2-oxoacid:ferredoxin oxidoreductase gamma subunit